VFGLAYERAALRDGADGMAAVLAVSASLLAACSYGFSASFTKRYLTGVPPMAQAAGSQISATALLALPAIGHWPQASPPWGVWLAAAALAFACTGAAYIIFFRLISRAGPANALTVTYLVPAFAVLWGVVFLGEWPTPSMLLGCVLILLGTSLATGWIGRPRTNRAS
jgi:drug/metabolite transporter (DMT)-like permease